MRGLLLCILRSHRAPLQQLEARFSIRAAHPSSAAVDDEVQYALAAEAAQLSGVCTQLAQRVDAADTQIHRLDELSAALLSNIADKEVAMTLEERVAMLDGRLCPAVPPTPSVLSVSGRTVKYDMHLVLVMLMVLTSQMGKRRSSSTRPACSLP